MSNISFILMENRCGSSWLIDMLNSTGVLPLAQEVNKHADLAGHREFWRSAKENGAVLKCNTGTFKWLKPFVGNPAQYKYVWLQRADLWQQSVSTILADNSKEWIMIRGKDGVRVGGRSISDVPVTQLNKNKIRSYHHWLVQATRDRAIWFREHGIDPLVIFYEDMCSNPDQIVRDVIKHFSDLDYNGPISSDLCIQRTKASIQLAKELSEE